MRIIAQPRRSGKTIELIKMCAQAEADGEVSYIVCHTRKEAYRIHQLAQDMELRVPFPLTYDEFTSQTFSRSFINNLLIDNLEMLIQYLALGTNIAAVTINTED